MRPKGSAELLSDRRKRALKLLDEEFSLNEIARRLHCAASSVMRWRNEWRRFPAGAILSGSSEKAHAKPRAPAAQDLTEGRRCQRLPHRIVDDKASGGGGSKNLSRAVPFQHRWPTPPSVWVDSPEA